MKKLRAIFAKVLSWVLARYEGTRFRFDSPVIPGGYTGPRYDLTATDRMEAARLMRTFERDDELVQALAGKFENFVVGSSPQITPASSDPTWNAKAKAWFDQWTTMPDIASRQSFGCLLSLAARRWFIEGDVFFLLTIGREDLGRATMPRIQLIEGHLLRTPPDFAKDPFVHDGVRFDRNGRATAYYFAREIGAGQYEWGNPYDADSVVPVFEPERPGELRGMTHFHACLRTLQEIKHLHWLEMQAAAENASTSEWIETENGEMDPAEFRRQRLLPGGITNAGTATVEAARMDYYREISGGRARILKRGDKVHLNPGQRPSVTTIEYWRLKRELVCASVEIPYCIVFPDSMQGTVYRGALDMACAAFRSRHSVVAEAAKRIYRYVMSFAIRTDRGLSDPPADWDQCTIRPPRAPNVDVGRNATAEAEALMDGRTNYDLIYGPQGLDWQTELRKLNAQLEFINKECPALAAHMAAMTKPAQLQPGAPRPQPDPEEH